MKISNYTHYYNAGRMYSGQDIANIFDAVVQDICNSTHESLKQIYIFDETFYLPYNDIIELDKLLKETKVDIFNAKIIIHTLFEPRFIQDSLLVEYLLNVIKIDPSNIIYLTCAQQTSSNSIHKKIKIVELTKLGISFCSMLESKEVTPISIDEYNKRNIKKTKLVSCLTKRISPQRYIIASLIHKNFEKQEYEISLGVEKNFNNDWNLMSFWTRESIKAGGNLFFYEQLPLVFDSREIDSDKYHQYKMSDEKLRHCMFDIVNESIGYDYPLNYRIHNEAGRNYTSEKSFKHLYNFQIPIFNCNPEFIPYFKKTFNTDIFEDIVPVDKIYSIENTIERAKEIVNFLVEFKNNPTVNYEEIKERLRYNYNSIKRIHLEAGTEYLEGMDTIKRLIEG